jgi:hypothetical protein
LAVPRGDPGLPVPDVAPDDDEEDYFNIYYSENSVGAFTILVSGGNTAENCIELS